MKIKRMVVVEQEVDHTDLYPVRPAPDGYRGDMSCLEIEHPYKSGNRLRMGDPLDSYYEVVDPDGVVVGVIRHIYGNGGHGKLAASEYYPKEDIQQVQPTIAGVLELAAKLPSGLNDPQAAEKLLAEREELVDALSQGDTIGALTEAADAVYYAAKHLDWVARQVGVSVDGLFELAVAKYSLRARPGNPKDDAAEREAVANIYK